jgi:hypothetical protein
MPGKEIKGRSKRVMYSEGSKGKTPTTPKEKKFAALAPPPNKITFSDKIVGATKNKRTTAMAGGMMRKKVMGGGSMMRMEKSMGGGLYENIKKKKDRIAAGSGEKMRKVGAKGAPTAQNFKDAAKTAKKA